MQEKLFVTGRSFFHSGRTGGEASAAKMLCTVLMAKHREKVIILEINRLFSYMSEKIHKKFTESIVKIALVLAG